MSKGNELFCGIDPGGPDHTVLSIPRAAELSVAVIESTASSLMGRPIPVAALRELQSIGITVLQMTEDGLNHIPSDQLFQKHAAEV